MTRLAVFDCDGTLVDSQANIVRAMRDAFAAVGVAAPGDHAIRQIVGLSLPEIMLTLLPDAEPTLHAALADGYRGAYQRLRAAGTLAVEPLYPGIRDALVELDRRGWALGVATGKSDRGSRPAPRPPRPRPSLRQRCRPPTATRRSRIRRCSNSPCARRARPRPRR